MVCSHLAEVAGKTPDKFGSMVLTGKPSGLTVSLFVFLLWISAHIVVLEH